MKHILDVHTHTIASGHAYSTMNEMIQAAADAGLELLGITEHSLTMPGTCHEFYFHNTRIIDRHRYPVELMLGTELNIMDEDGSIDMSKQALDYMDICIASMHVPCYRGGDKKANTTAYLNAMKNPYVDIIGHPDDSRFPIDYKELVYGAKENHVLLELNNSSLNPMSTRQGAWENYQEMLRWCKEYEADVVINSDAHIDYLVGAHQEVHKLLKETDFPEKQVVNQSISELKKYLHRYNRLL